MTLHFSTVMGTPPRSEASRRFVQNAAAKKAAKCAYKASLFLKMLFSNRRCDVDSLQSNRNQKSS